MATIIQTIKLNIKASVAKGLVTKVPAAKASNIKSVVTKAPVAKTLVAKTLVACALAASIQLAQLVSSADTAIAMPNNDQIIKYFNPVHEKSYLNEKQDRIIKKKSFKTQDLKGIATIPNKDIGLFAALEPGKLYQADYIDQLLAKDEVNGLACLLSWRSLEPDEEIYDWTAIDGLLQSCARHNKQLILRVSTCGIDLPGVKPTEGEQKSDAKNEVKNQDKVAAKTDANKDAKANTKNATKTSVKTDAAINTATSDTPAWVYDAGTQYLPYNGKDGNTHLMPIFWDGTYLAKWSNFVNELGRRYDKNPNFQSIGITGGGILGGTNVVPEFTGNKDTYNKLETDLKEKYQMSPGQLVRHWKYVADVFPKAFPDQRLNFDIDPPTPNRKGQDCLDEISDYLVYRYGQRIYITRQNIKNDKHGFDEYRLLLKFKNDTIMGYQFTSDLDSPAVKPLLPKVTKNALDDGISFAELPAQFFDSTDEAIKSWLTQLRAYLGYQLVLQELTLPASAQAGKTMPIHFAFLNTGSASPKRPAREMDKASPSSYKVQLEFKDPQGKTKALLRHTPTISTVDWLGIKPIIWEQDLKVPPLKPGKYDIHLAIIDDTTNHKLNYCKKISDKPEQIGNDLLVGSLEISAVK